MCVFRSDYEYYVATRVKFYFLGGGLCCFYGVYMLVAMLRVKISLLFF